MNSVVTGQFLVFFSFITDVAFLRTDVVESVVEVLVCIDGVLLEKIVEIPFRIVVRGGKVLCEKSLS